jgi:hypothetical protein
MIDDILLIAVNNVATAPQVGAPALAFTQLEVLHCPNEKNVRTQK